MASAVFNLGVSCDLDIADLGLGVEFDHALRDVCLRLEYLYCWRMRHPTVDCDDLRGCPNHR